MTELNKWERYDVARSRLKIMVGHYAELIRDEEKKSMPDTSKIEAWEDLQDELSDRETMLSVDDTEAIEQINTTYGPAATAIMKG